MKIPWRKHAFKKKQEEKQICIPETALNLVKQAECAICLPHELTILECDCIVKAMRSYTQNSNADFLFIKEDIRTKLSIHSAFDLNNFIFDHVYAAPVSECLLTHEPSGNSLYWDGDDKFCSISGTRQFCRTAYPHDHEILWYYYLHATLNEFEDEEELEAYFIQLTKL